MTNEMDKSMRKKESKHRLKFIMVFSAIALMAAVSVSHGAFFDTAGQSARAMGMGEVFLASSSDAAGYWYNPAGLVNFKNKQLGFGYGKPVAVISELMSSQINYVTPLGDNGGLGLGFAYSGIDESSDMVISGAYGRSLSEKFSIGLNVKVMRWAADGQDDPYNGGKDDDFSKTSFSLDLSAVYSLGSLFGMDDFVTGLYVKDALMPNISEAGDGDDGKIPLEAGIGIMAQKNDLVIGGDAAFCDGIAIFRVGAESGITGSNLKIRGGFAYESDFEDELEEADFDLGFGYAFGSLGFDYAYNIPLAFKDTSGKHYVSFGISF